MRSLRKARSRANVVLVSAGQPAKANDVGGKDRREFPALSHRGSIPTQML